MPESAVEDKEQRDKGKADAEALSGPGQTQVGLYEEDSTTVK